MIFTFRFYYYEIYISQGEREREIERETERQRDRESERAREREREREEAELIFHVLSKMGVGQVGSMPEEESENPVTTDEQNEAINKWMQELEGGVNGRIRWER